MAFLWQAAKELLSTHVRAIQHSLCHSLQGSGQCSATGFGCNFLHIYISV